MKNVPPCAAFPLTIFALPGQDACLPTHGCKMGVPDLTEIGDQDSAYFGLLLLYPLRKFGHLSGQQFSLHKITGL